MNVRIVRTKRALRDLDEQATFIQKDSPQAAIRFLEAAEAAFELLARTPQLGSLYELPGPKFTGMRMWTIKGLQHYLVFCRPIERGVEIVRVLHGARDIPAILDEQQGEPIQGASLPFAARLPCRAIRCFLSRRVPGHPAEALAESLDTRGRGLYHDEFALSGRGGVV